MYCQWNSFTAQAANRWNGIDMPGCQRAKVWRHDSVQPSLEADDNGMLARQLMTLLNLLFGYSRAIIIVLHPKTLPAMARPLCRPRRWTWGTSCYSIPIRVVPVTSCNNESLHAFTKKCLELIDALIEKPVYAATEWPDQSSFPQWNDGIWVPNLQINGLQVAVSSATLGGVNPHPSMLGAYHQYQEIGDVPNSGTRIPGQAGKHQYSACQPLCRQGEKDVGRSHQNLQRGFPLRSLALPLPREAQHGIPGYSFSPTILPLPADRLTVQVALNNSNQNYEVLLSHSQPSQEKLY